MDNKTIQQYGEEILCYRLRTARQKKRMVYEDWDKQLIELYKEERALSLQKRNLGWDILAQPYQRGWIRSFVLRDDVARSNQAEFFENILRKINTTCWCYRRDFMVKKRRFGKKVYEVAQQSLLEPGPDCFAKLKFTDMEKQFFHVKEYYFNGACVIKFAFNEPWRFVLCTRPNIITRVRKTDPELESRLKEIDSYLEKGNYRSRQEKLVHGNWYKYWKRNEADTGENGLKNKSFSRILDEIKEVIWQN